MIISQKAGNLSSFKTNNQTLDWLPVEWFETNKRILHKQTSNGKPLTLQFLNSNPDLKEGDILWANDEDIIAVNIIPCEVLVLQPKNIIEAAGISYETGNRHLPLYYEGNELLIPYDVPLLRSLESMGYIVQIDSRKLNHSIKTSVLAHMYGGGSGLLSKLLEKQTGQ